MKIIQLYETIRYRMNNMRVNFEVSSRISLSIGIFSFSMSIDSISYFIIEPSEERL